jgi:hypothetical protein
MQHMAMAMHCHKHIAAQTSPQCESSGGARAWFNPRRWGASYRSTSYQGVVTAQWCSWGRRNTPPERRVAAASPSNAGMLLASCSRAALPAVLSLSPCALACRLLRCVSVGCRMSDAHNNTQSATAPAQENLLRPRAPPRSRLAPKTRHPSTLQTPN